ncbi:MAG TPA: T9SS type A sorting domain-containing protein [Ignavibacteriaceae bacterium]|nr:T9SS type A sorting domain-containing protein [Ignavibacteriaceae bacterium]
MKTISLLLFVLTFSFILPVKAGTVDSSAYSGDWGNPGTWQSGKVPGQNDDIIIRPQDVVTIGWQVSNNTALCHNLTVFGTLTFTNDLYGSSGNLYSTGNVSIDYSGTVTAAKDTNFGNSYGSSSFYAGGGFANYGTFIPEVDDSYGSRTIYVDVNSGVLDLYQNTTMNILDITGNVALTGLLTVHQLLLYKNLDNTTGQLKISDNGLIWRSDTGSIAVAPTFGKNILIQYANNNIITTGPELPDNVYEVDVRGDLQLNKSIHVTHLFKFPYYGSYSHVYTGPDTVLIEDSASINFTAGSNGNYIVGNLAQVYTKQDSLVFPVGTPGRPRPVSIKLNNLSGGPDTIMVNSDSLVNLTSLPSGIAAIEKTHYWNISASSNYSGNIDANISLEFSSEDIASLFQDYIGNKMAITAIHGDSSTGIWDLANNIISDSSNEAYTVGVGSFDYVTGHFNSFGSFTTGNTYEIPNGDFEYWLYGLPYGWSFNNVYYAVTLKKSSDVNSGSASVEGDATDSSGTIIPPRLKMTLPFNKFLKSLQGYYKFNSASHDKFYVSVKLFKDSTVVAEGSYTDSLGASAYKQFNLDVSKAPNNTVKFPDSLQIEITMKPGDSGLFHTGSQYIVDDVTIDNITGIENNPQQNTLPSKFTLYQNYPNPFNPSTKIKFDLTETSKVRLAVYNILGEEVKTLVNKSMSPGEHVATFNASDLSSGIYFYRINADGESGKAYLVTKKMILLK